MEITQELIDTYTKGECHYLAFAINAVTGWTVITIGHGMHWAVRTPAGDLLDITGLSTDEEMSAKWDTNDRRATITIPEDDELDFLWDDVQYDYMRAHKAGVENDSPERAERVAEIVLDTYTPEWVRITSDVDASF